MAMEIKKIKDISSIDESDDTTEIKHVYHDVGRTSFFIVTSIYFIFIFVELPQHKQQNNINLFHKWRTLRVVSANVVPILNV
jgi:hypothetical protein